jgi:hypothetical protein
MSTRAERTAIVRRLEREAGMTSAVTPSSSVRTRRRRLTPEQAKAQRRRVVQILQAEAGLPVTDFEQRRGRRPRGKAQPIDVRELRAEWDASLRRQRALGTPPWMALPWRPRW